VDSTGLSKPITDLLVDSVCFDPIEATEIRMLLEASVTSSSSSVVMLEDFGTIEMKITWGIPFCFDSILNNKRIKE
jgi:hypothetical protein